MHSIVRLGLVLLVSLAFACDDETPTDPVPAPEPEEPVAEEPAPEPVANDEACVLGVVVSWDGATPTPPGVTRSEEEARARAEELLGRVNGGTPLTEVARAESDAPTSRARGGAMGTWTRDGWPEMHAALKDPIFGVEVGMHPEVVQAPYGFIVAERCPVEKVHTRHILIRYAGARNAPDDVTRSQEEARTLAERIHEEVTGGADFATIAQEKSEDGSAERGGDLGEVGRGLLMPAYEAAAFAMQADQISEVVETPFGFHVIQRL